MSAGMIFACEHIIKISLDYNTGAGIGLQYLEFPAEPVSISNDRMNEVIHSLPLDRHLMLQPGQGIIPGRKSAFREADQAWRKLVRLLLTRIGHYGRLVGHQNAARESSSRTSRSSRTIRRLK